MDTGHTSDVERVTTQVFATFDEIWERKNAFFGVFFVILCISYGFLVWIDFIPEDPEGADDGAPQQNAPLVVPAPMATTSSGEVVPLAPVVAATPAHIRIPKIATDVAVLNPESADMADLDKALLKGVVRHPDSADFGDPGTMVLFGHSSYLPQVLNQNFKAFNGIQKLETGDAIEVASDDATYVYHVTKVYKVAASEASVPLEQGTAKLILITCNSFGSKDDRYVVEAEFVKKTLL